MSDTLVKVVTATATVHWTAMQKLWPKLKKYNVPRIKVNNRRWRIAGMAYCIKHEVEFSSKFFNNYKNEMLCIIIPHELIHIADFIMFGEDNTDNGHGPAWRKLMVEYGLLPDRYHHYYINKSDPVVKLL